MGLTDLFSDVISSIGFGEVQAEAPAAEPEEQELDSEEKDTEDGEATEDSEEQAEEEEEEEEEPEDVKPKLEEDCANSSQCRPFKHHFDECVERVTSHQDDPDHKGPHEDCIEEFFHLQHCATQCAAPTLWKMLK